MSDDAKPLTTAEAERLQYCVGHDVVGTFVPRDQLLATTRALETEKALVAEWRAGAEAAQTDVERLTREKAELVAAHQTARVEASLLPLSMECPDCAVVWDEAETAGRLMIRQTLNKSRSWRGGGAVPVRPSQPGTQLAESARAQAARGAAGEAVTHLTEWGIGVLLGAKILPSSDRTMANVEFSVLGLRPDTAACTGANIGTGRGERVGTLYAGSQIPTCPRCAVLRDEAIETGRVPSGVGTGVRRRGT